MKKIFPIALVALFGAMTIMPSCKKSDSSSKPAQSMIATVNGASFNANSSNIDAAAGAGIFSLTGISGKSMIIISLDSFNATTPATYKLGAGQSNSISWIPDSTNFGAQHPCDSGSIIFTSVSATSAKGTFTGYSTYDSTNIASGTFTVNLQ